jgi:D-tyrosyl-tRNA(Tyr) deacylase
MRAVIQRVKEARVVVEGAEVSRIERGILTLLGVAKGDEEAKIAKMISKICDLRIFEDEQGKMNRSLKEVGGAHLIVSQFTLLGDCSAGRRPSFTGAEAPDRAKQLYELALKHSRDQGVTTAGGVFQADMKITLTNDGPVTFVLDI